MVAKLYNKCKRTSLEIVVLNICVSPKFLCWNLTPKVMALGSQAYVRRLGSEGEILMSGFNVLVKEIPAIFAAIFIPCEDQWDDPVWSKEVGPDQTLSL